MFQITNTLTGQKEPWSPRRPGEVGLYVCGVTVYDHCHLGHARSAVVFDVIRKYLESKNLSVRYVKNFTDVDDKIIHRAQREGKGWKEIAETYIRAYESDMKRLNVQPPSLAPKATDHIPEMIQIIAGLISKGVAYPVEGDVYYEVMTFPSYGKLSKRKTDELTAGARVEVDERKKNPLDFALWKASKPGEPAWESPWGMGRPGWHIECSAMAMKHLGETLDLHGGGKDLIFPHHENEIAQSEAYSGKEFVRCWIHHGFVTVDQEKMSKSLGNFFTIKEIFEKSAHFSEEMIAEVVRFYLLSTHYRSAIDFSDRSLKAAKSSLDNFYTLFQKIEELGDPPAASKVEDLQEFSEGFERVMEDDFNTAEAIGILQKLRAKVNAELDAGKAQWGLQAKDFIGSRGRILGLFQIPTARWSFKPWETALSVESTLEDEVIDRLIREREEARRKKEWKKSDEIRDRLSRAGIVIEDRPDGTTRVKR